MASHKDDELPNDMTHSASVSEQLSRCDTDDTAEELQSDTLNATVKSQKSGKFRKTALTFFGVRKGICILPSFFGGRNKNQNRWSSKKGLSRSKTHDGLSKAGLDDNQRSGYASAGDFEYHSQKDPAGEFHSNCHNECSHPAADQKCFALIRQKKGLRSFFHSIKHHRNHRNVTLEKNEMIPLSSPPCKKEEPVVRVTECLGSEPDVPNFANVVCDVSTGPECTDFHAVALEKNVVQQESPKSVLADEIPDEDTEEMSLIAVVSSEYEESSREHGEACLKLRLMSEPELKCETPAGSTDQLNLIFGDVASLKSFDSLTGCGDIIADQDDDSITESTVSGERSRNAGKRTSCFLTYQGGGEEMASPDDLDEDSLPNFWGNDAAEEICYNCNEDHTADLTANLSSSHHMDIMNSNSAQQASGLDTSSIADVLTPQSEHQESVPNSDEGYYDSTTPGPEEGQEKTDRIREDRLPRDSYSGDALYELFAPDESLISPHYENKSKLPSSKQCEYLSESGDVTDSAFLPEIGQLQISAELYQVQDFLELTSMCGKSKELTPFTVGLHDKGLNKNSNLDSKPQTLVNKNQTKPDVFDGKANVLAPPEKRTKSINADCENKRSNITFRNTSNPDFETFCEPKEKYLEENKPVALPYKNINPRSTDFNCELDDGQTVCFSQALVDYTKHTQLLSNSPSSVAGLETNSAFTPNMQALPTIVTFDVVDLHNEGEYDEQIHMDLEEDISSPYQEYQEFEESYLQKDAFAECDYQMLDLYEQNLFSNAWAIASLPRHMGLTRVSQSMPSPLSLDRRSRSLDTESLELKMPEKYRENRAATGSYPQAEIDSNRESFPYHKKNALVSTSEVRDKSSIMALSRQTRSEMALSLPLTDEEITEKVQSLSQNQVKHKIISSMSHSDYSVNHNRSQCLYLDVSERDSQNAELCSRQSQLPLQSDSSLPHSTFVFPGIKGEDLLVKRVTTSDDADDVFFKTATNSQSYNQCSKSRPVSREGVSHAGIPLNAGVSNDEVDYLSDT